MRKNDVAAGQPHSTSPRRFQPSISARQQRTLEEALQDALEQNRQLELEMEQARRVWRLTLEHSREETLKWKRRALHGQVSVIDGASGALSLPPQEGAVTLVPASVQRTPPRGLLNFLRAAACRFLHRG